MVAGLLLIADEATAGRMLVGRRGTTGESLAMAVDPESNAPTEGAPLQGGSSSQDPGQSGEQSPQQPSPEQPVPEEALRSQRLESLGQLAGDAAHDFNNVLGVILGYVELARMGLGEDHPQALRQLGLALSTVDRARKLADGLLEFAPRVARAPDLADLSEAVRVACDLLGRTTDPRIKVELTLSEDVPCTPLDRLRLGQVVTNLFMNAAQALPEGGRIDVTTERVVLEADAGRPAGDYAVLHVRDSGGGVPPALREQIFEPRFSTRPEDRSGLGLWVARGIVGRHGGWIEVDGGPEGAGFQAWLPSALRVPEAQGPSATAGLAGADVLVLDADAGVRGVLRAHLELEGFRVHEAASAVEGEQLLRARSAAFRLLFVAERLPDAKGADVAWLAAGLPEPIPAVLLSAGGAVPRLPGDAAVLALPFLHADLTRLLREDLRIQTG